MFWGFVFLSDTGRGLGEKVGEREYCFFGLYFFFFGHDTHGREGGREERECVGWGRLFRPSILFFSSFVLFFILVVFYTGLCSIF